MQLLSGESGKNSEMSSPGSLNHPSHCSREVEVDKFLISKPAVMTTQRNSCPCQMHQLIHLTVNARIIDRLHNLAE